MGQPLLTSLRATSRATPASSCENCFSEVGWGGATSLIQDGQEVMADAVARVVRLG
jgi:hypothetical protein